MKPAPTLARLALFLLGLLPALWSAGPAWAKEPIEPLPVAVSVPPLRTLVDRVGGAYVRTQTLVPPGQAPEDFAPGPGRVAELAGARLYVGTGAAFESAWTGPLRATNPRLRILDAGAGGTPGRRESGTEPGYAWTSPPLAKRMAWRIRDALIEVDPARAAVYRRRTERLNEEFDTLDRELRGRLAPITQRRFMASPPVWGPFAATYGLIQIPIEPAGLTAMDGGHAGNAGAVADLTVMDGRHAGNAGAVADLIATNAATALIDQARREGARVILLPRPQATAVAERVAEYSLARVYSVDPLAADSFAVLRRLAGLIADSEER